MIALVGVCLLYFSVVVQIGTICAQQVVQFNYNGEIQNFTVPSDVNTILVDMVGAEAGTGGSDYTEGGGARVQTTISVVPGSILHIYCGGKGGDYVDGMFNNYQYNRGGWNGGGEGKYLGE